MSEINVKDTVKYSIFKREAHSELYQTTKMEFLQKCLIWYYDIPRSLNMPCDKNMPAIHKVLNMREHARE